jgi:hypothetical protein
MSELSPFAAGLGKARAMTGTFGMIDAKDAAPAAKGLRATALRAARDQPVRELERHKQELIIS